MTASVQCVQPTVADTVRDILPTLHPTVTATFTPSPAGPVDVELNGADPHEVLAAKRYVLLCAVACARAVMDETLVCVRALHERGVR